MGRRERNESNMNTQRWKLGTVESTVKNSSPAPRGPVMGTQCGQGCSRGIAEDGPSAMRPEDDKGEVKDGSSFWPL